MSSKINTFKILNLTNLDRMELQQLLSPDIIKFEKPNSGSEFGQLSKLKATVVISLASLQVLSSFINRTSADITIEKETPNGKEVVIIKYKDGNQNEILKKLIEFFDVELSESK